MSSNVRMSRSGTWGDLRRSGIRRCSAAKEGKESGTLNTHNQRWDKKQCGDRKGSVTEEGEESETLNAYDQRRDRRDQEPI